MAEELRVVTTAGSEAEAEMIGEWLAEAGIPSKPQLSSSNILLGAAAPRALYVEAKDYDRALAVINAEVPTDEELESLSQDTQLTQPKHGEPIEIPVPRREDWNRVLKRAAPGAKSHKDQR
jgi:hypothetical protein